MEFIKNITTASVKNVQFIQLLQQNGTIQSQEVADVLKTIDRADFCSMSPYFDSPQSIGYNNAKRCLDIGSGTGILTLAFAKMMKNKDAVSYGIEHIGEHHKDYLTNGKVVIVEGDGREGLKQYAPFDCIHVGAAAEELPKVLCDQLAKGGRMLIPAGKPNNQQFLIVDKDLNGKITVESAFGVRYVPLTSKQNQLNGFKD